METILILLLGVAIFVALIVASRTLTKGQMRMELGPIARKLDEYLLSQNSKGALNQIGFKLEGAAIVYEWLEGDGPEIEPQLHRVYRTSDQFFFWCFCQNFSTPVIRQITAERAAQVMSLNKYHWAVGDRNDPDQNSRK